MIANEKSITLTADAASHVQGELAKSMQSGSNTIGLKLGVKVSGCSGYSYVLDWVKAGENTDSYRKFNSHNVDIYVDPQSYNFVAGTQIDYIQQGISRTMVFRNPNVTAECGCGESFTIDKEKS